MKVCSEFFQCSKGLKLVKKDFETLREKWRLISRKIWAAENCQIHGVTHILRENGEIKVGEFRVSKLAFLAHSEALNFDFDAFLHFLKVEIDQITNIQSP